jgi:beta-apo-4'-carotenal oxygenase
LHDNQDLIVEACKRDIGKSSFETHLTELAMVMNDIIYLADNLAKFAKDEPAEDVAFANKLLGPKIRKDPLGIVLVIGYGVLICSSETKVTRMNADRCAAHRAYNFPVQLSLGPFIGAIAAGCTAVLKPSEAAPNAAAVMQKIIAEVLDPSAYTVIQGAVPETTALLDQKWDKIFYTGSANVGTIIAKKAAETLTPVALELGGRNPAIITKNADPRLAARRLLWNKILNAGQVCVSQNYILIDKEILPAFLREIKIALKEFYPNGAQNSPDYGKIVNTRQFARLKRMLDETSGKIILGGTMDEKTLFLEPTVVQVDSLTDSLVVDESFGPLIPIYAVSNLDEAIQVANEVDGTPLAIYPFGNSRETEKGSYPSYPLSPNPPSLSTQTNHLPQFSPKSAPAAPASTTAASTSQSPPSPSAASAAPAPAPTTAAPPTNASRTAAPSPPPRVGWRACWACGTRRTRSPSGTRYWVWARARRISIARGGRLGGWRGWWALQKVRGLWGWRR